MVTDSEVLDVLDVEEYARSGKDKPKAKLYRIRIDRDRYDTRDPKLNGRAILALAGKTPETHLLTQKVAGGAPIPIASDQEVDLRAKGVERFMTVPREATEGRELRRQFKLPRDDREYLEERGEPWEAIMESGVQWLLLHGFEIPPGFNTPRATAAIRIVSGYPEAALDMVYIDPPLARADGKPINALSTLQIDGRGFQQWSRHRTAGSTWRVGEDNLASHCAYARGWLTDELLKR